MQVLGTRGEAIEGFGDGEVHQIDLCSIVFDADLLNCNCHIAVIFHF